MFPSFILSFSSVDALDDLESVLALKMLMIELLEKMVHEESKGDCNTNLPLLCFTLTPIKVSVENEVLDDEAVRRTVFANSVEQFAADTDTIESSVSCTLRKQRSTHMESKDKESEFSTVSVLPISGVETAETTSVVGMGEFFSVESSSQDIITQISTTSTTNYKWVLSI